MATYQEYSARGIGANELRKEITAGRLHRVVRGTYAAGPPPRQRWRQYEERCVTVGQSLPEHQLLVRESAAAVLHIPLLATPELIYVHDVRASHSSRSTRRYISAGPFAEVVNTRGLRTSSLARTAVDLARFGGFAQGLAAMDAVLRAGDNRAALVAALETGGRRLRGIPVARAAYQNADLHSESPGESWLRAILLQMTDLPPILIQPNIFGVGGVFVARPDLLIENLVIEFDGKGKYADTKVLDDERDRGNALNELGFVFARFVWADLYSPDAVEAKIRRQLDLARRTRRSPSVIVMP